ncbi:uncharacterized protein LOC131436706 [Malaya genurostris]|uniref:uncharacterized protein LOC131436706 n=1 Tax=Malaya genurostris TaxID=325434 RepID=UPI0026F3BF31|nr:uncharacterized protein LOC131436706 [Malaya genurostris]
MKLDLDRLAIVNGYILGLGALVFFSVASYFGNTKSQYLKETFFDYKGGSDGLNNVVILLHISIFIQFVLLIGVLHKRFSTIFWYGVLCLVQVVFAILLVAEIPENGNIVVYVVLYFLYVVISLLMLMLFADLDRGFYFY